MNNMSNSITIEMPIINENRILYRYNISGSWSEAFSQKEFFFVEYSHDITKLPEGIAVIPLLANILPIAWIYNAKIILPVCDKDFYNSIEDFKQGYKVMYPSVKFGGQLVVDNIQLNRPINQNGSVAFFSGGVDAFNTLVSHEKEKPILLTVWGADVSFEDLDGWNRIVTHLKHTSEEFETDFITIKSSCRRFINERILTQKVSQSGDGWWHGFQHGLGIIGHAAPLMYILGKSTVYFASSFTAADKGKVTCASDPTIDNFIQFCGAHVVHDGYELTRQMKIHNIVKFSHNSQKQILLRVCWQSIGGSNCCSCEKCWRTILGIYAEGETPRNYGFEYSNYQLWKLSMKMKFSEDKMLGPLRYNPIQQAMHSNLKKKDLPKPIRWFYDVDTNRLSKSTLIKKAVHKIKKYF